MQCQTNKKGYSTPSRTLQRLHPLTAISSETFSLDCKLRKRCRLLCDSKQESSVSQRASSVPAYGNTIINGKLIENHIRSWQAHLERISDFLLPGKGSWWLEQENGNVKFFDGERAVSTHQQGPLLHHFRSSSFSAEEKYLQKCWKQCLENGVALPINVVWVEDEHGQMKLVRQHPEDTMPSKNSTLQDEEPSTKAQEQDSSDLPPI